MKRNVYIFRHGETDYNLEYRWQGCGLDPVLNGNGLDQAKKLAEKVASLRLTILYSSPLVRAVQTANILAQRVGIDIPIIILQDLREGHFGDAEGLTFAEVRGQFGEDFVSSVCWPTVETWDRSFPHGESKHDMFNRALGCLNYILRCTNEVNIGIVCHAGIMSALKCGLNLEQTPNPNCSVLHLQYDPETHLFEQIHD